MAVRKPKAEPPDKVDRTVKGVRSAVGRLVGLLGDEDEAVVGKAVNALGEVGPFAVGPLASALSRAPSAPHRLVIVAVLACFGAQAEVPVMLALLSASQKDPDPVVKLAAGAALSAVAMAGLKRSPNATRRVPED